MTYCLTEKKDIPCLLKEKKYNDNILGKICINMREKQPSLTFRSGHLTRECVNTTKNLT